MFPCAHLTLLQDDCFLLAMYMPASPGEEVAHPAQPLTLSQRVARPQVCGVNPHFCCMLISGCVLCSIVAATADPHMSVPGFPRVPARGGPRKGTCRPLPQQAAPAPVLCVSMWRVMLEAGAWAPPLSASSWISPSLGWLFRLQNKEIGLGL